MSLIQSAEEQAKSTPIALSKPFFFISFTKPLRPQPTSIKLVGFKSTIYCAYLEP